MKYSYHIPCELVQINRRASARRSVVERTNTNFASEYDKNISTNQLSLYIKLKCIFCKDSPWLIFIFRNIHTCWTKYRILLSLNIHPSRKNYVLLLHRNYNFKSWFAGIFHSFHYPLFNALVKVIIYEYKWF